MQKKISKTVETGGKRNKKIIRKIERQQTFRKIFLTIILGMMGTFLLIFAAVNGIVKRMITEQNIAVSTLEFSKIQEEFDEQNRKANMLATEVLLDDICSEFLFATKETEIDSLGRQRVCRKLQRYQSVNSVVESVYIYNGVLDRFVSSRSGDGYLNKQMFGDQGIVKILDDSNMSSSRNLFKRVVGSPYGDSNDKARTVYTCVLKNMQGDKVLSAIVVNLDLSSAFQRFQDIEEVQASQIVVWDKEQRIVAEFFKNLSVERQQIEKLVEDMSAKGVDYTEFHNQGTRYFVSWIHSQDTEFDYLKISKWDQVFTTVLQFRKYMIFIYVLMVLAAIVGATASTVSIYRLYGQLEKKHKSTIHVSDEIQLRENFIFEFIYKRKVFGKKQLYEQFEQYCYPIKEGQLFRVLILQVEDYFELVEEYGIDGVYDIKYGFRNIFEEVLGIDYYVDGVINRDNSLIFLISGKAGEGSIGQIEERFREFCESVESFAKRKFSVITSEESVAIEEVPELAQKMFKVKNESFFYPSNSFLLYEKICEEHIETINYRNLNVGKLADMLRGGSDILEQYHILADSLKGCGSSEYMNTMIWLGVTVVRNLQERYITDSEQEENLNHFLAQLTKCEKKEKVDALFEEVFSQIIEIQEKAGVKKGVTGKMEEVQTFIKEHYADMNITLEYLGDEFGVSANYLGRVFKKEAGMSVAEYLNNERLAHVIEALEQTDKSAKDIAESCGFVSSNYFYTYFKKKVGVSPQVYRQQYRENKRK